MEFPSPWISPFVAKQSQTNVIQPNEVQKVANGDTSIPVTWKGSSHKRQKPQAPTPQAPIRNRQTSKVPNAKGLNRNTNLT